MGELVRPGFVQEGRCFRMVYLDELQATHCYEATGWRGRFTVAKGKVHRMWACEAQRGRNQASGFRPALSSSAASRFSRFPAFPGGVPRYSSMVASRDSIFLIITARLITSSGMIFPLVASAVTSKAY